MSDTSEAPEGHDDGGSSVEDRARKMGWRPQDEFKGDPEKWRPAQEFLDRGLNELPVLRDRYKNLEKKLDEQSKTVSEFLDFARKGEERAYERARKELLEKRESAVAMADTESFKKIEAELTELKPPPSPKVMALPPEAAEVAAWVEENPWYNANPEMQDDAKAIEANLFRNRPNMPLAERLAETKKRIQAMYPDQFQNHRRASAPSVSEGSGAPPPRGKAKSYENLPADAKKACDKFVRSIPGFTREEYCKTYDWGDA